MEGSVAELPDCIRMALDCADIRAALAAVLSRHTGSSFEVIEELLNAYRDVYATCAQECGNHADRHEHCRICAEACRRCEQSCIDLPGAIG